MTLFGWVVSGVITTLVVLFGIRFFKDLLWNRKLGSFHKTKKIIMPKVPVIYWIKRSYGFVLTSFLLIATISSGAFALPNMLGDRILVNAEAVGSGARLRALIANATKDEDFGFLREGVAAEFDNQAGAPEKQERDFIDTNVQVGGVDEADIVKTDGNTIYYATRFNNQVRIIDVKLDGTVDIQANIDLDDMYVDSLYLTDEFLIVIGYINDTSFFGSEGGFDTWHWGFTSHTGAIRIYNRDTLEAEYKLETDFNFYQHRLIDNSLFLVSNKSIHTEELRPKFTTTIGDITNESYLGYNSIFYFDDIPIHNMTVITGINLATFDISAQAFLGNVSQIFASPTAIYTANNFYAETSLGEWEDFVQIVKYDLNIEQATVTYVGQAKLSGHITNQYWMDEYNEYFRVVTSSMWPAHNELHILREDDKTDDLVIIGSITEGLGKENETVKSVRFNEDLVYVVTFFQTDPLYTIDLSDPANPVILSYIEEPGFSTYLHVWGQDDRLIGFGFTADAQGRVTGLKISAYDTAETVPIDTYYLSEQGEGGFSYSYSEASRNPKAMMISPDKGIIAFPIMSWRHYQNAQGEWIYTFISQYLVFFIDFDVEDPADIITKPITIEHEPTEFYSGIDRGIYIDGIIYTLSKGQLVSFSLETNEILESIKFDSFFEDNPEKNHN